MLTVQPKQLPIATDTSWELELIKQLPERNNYVSNDNTLEFEQISFMGLGCFRDSDDYNNYLYMLANEEMNNFIPLYEGLNKEIDPNKHREIMTVFEMIRTDDLSINRLMAFLVGKKLMPLLNTNFSKHYQKIFIKIANEFSDKFGKESKEFKRVFIDMIKWGFNYIDVWNNQYDFTKTMPRVLWFGDATPSESWFLYLLIEFGIDVVIFHPNKTNILEDITSNLNILIYPEKKEILEYPKTKIEKIVTQAQQATEQVTNLLYTEDSMNYRPFQLKDYTPKSVRLSSTYNQIFQYANEDILLREGFDVKNGEVTIPTFFSKIYGLPKDKNTFYEDINKLCDRDLVYVYKEFPNVKTSMANMVLHYRDTLTDGELDYEKMIDKKYWVYKHLGIPFQKALAKSIIKFINETTIKINKPANDIERKQFLLGQAMKLPKEIIEMYIQFDFPRKNPCIILFNNGEIGNMSNEDAIYLELLRFLGFDVIIYNTIRGSDIEQYLEDNEYDSHWFEEISMGENFDNRNSVNSGFKGFMNKLFRG